MMGCAAGVSVTELRPGPKRAGGIRPQHFSRGETRGPSSALVDVLIGLLQSLVVLLLASGVYIALAVRNGGDSPAKSGPRHRPPVLRGRQLGRPQALPRTIATLS